MSNYGIPVDFEGLNQYNSLRSVAGRVQNDYNTAYFMRALYQRIISGAKFNLPEAWSEGYRYFKNVLFCNGFLPIIRTEKFGIIPQIGTPMGHGLFLQPTKIIVNQPLVQGWEGVIGEDCQVIHLTNDWMGVWDIVEHYAVRLSVAITSVDVSLMNSRVSILAAAKNKSASETLKYLYERISAGEPFSVYDKMLKDNGNENSPEPIWMYHQDVAQNYITDKLLADMETILKQFDNEVGILALGQKKERMITDEVATLNDDACARSSCWYECLSKSFDNAIGLFPELDGKFDFTLRYGGEEHEYKRKNDSDRVV